jgi:hypothetical protein
MCRLTEVDGLKTAKEQTNIQNNKQAINKQPINHPINQSIHQSINQSINQVGTCG